MINLAKKTTSLDKKFAESIDLSKISDRMVFPSAADFIRNLKKGPFDTSAKWGERLAEFGEVKVGVGRFDLEVADADERYFPIDITLDPGINFMLRERGIRIPLKVTAELDPETARAIHQSTPIIPLTAFFGADGDDWTMFRFSLRSGGWRYDVLIEDDNVTIGTPSFSVYDSLNSSELREMGLAYLTGDGVGCIDKAFAYRLLKIAADRGDWMALSNIEELDQMAEVYFSRYGE